MKKITTVKQAKEFAQFVMQSYEMELEHIKTMRDKELLRDAVERTIGTRGMVIRLLTEAWYETISCDVKDKLREKGWCMNVHDYIAWQAPESWKEPF
jgi:hypothetical protein